MYYYTWNCEGSTDWYIKHVAFPELESIYDKDYEDKARTVILTELTSKFIEKCREENIDVEIISTEVDSKIESAVEPFLSFYRYKRRLKLKWSLTFRSSKNLVSSPVSPILIEVIKYVLYAVLAALCLYFVYEWIKTFTVTKSTVTKKTYYYDQYGNIIKVEEVTESVEKPSIETLIFLFVALIIFGSIYYKSREKSNA